MGPPCGWFQMEAGSACRRCIGAGRFGLGGMPCEVPVEDQRDQPAGGEHPARRARSRSSSRVAISTTSPEARRRRTGISAEGARAAKSTVSSIRSPRLRAPATRGDARLAARAAGCPCRSGWSGGCARSCGPARRARPEVPGPWRPSRATSRSRNAGRRGSPSARPRRGSARPPGRGAGARPRGLDGPARRSLRCAERLRTERLVNRPAHHGLEVAAAGGEDVEVARVLAGCDQALAGLALGRDRAGGRDVVGGDVVAQHDERLGLELLDPARARRAAPRRAGGADRSSAGPRGSAAPLGASRAAQAGPPLDPRRP